MNIYKVSYLSGYNKTEKEVNVLAGNAADAVEHTNRYGKKNTYSDIEVISLEKVLEVQVRYSSKPKKRKK